MASILIVDDEKNIRTHLATHVRSLGHSVDAADDGADALTYLAHKRFDLVLSDVRMPAMDGLSLLREVKSRTPETVVVLMTAYATVAQAVEAMREGAYDYLVKPFSLDEVTLLLERVLEVQSLRSENRRLRRVIEEPVLLESRSPAMQHALETAKRAAASDVTLLLTGESGTGKSVLARRIHDWSPRRARPFVTIACTTLADHLVESELFGHVKGAFTGAWKDKPGRVEAAAGGTLFLDEVGELGQEMQAKLLRFLEERRFEAVGGSTTREVDTRIVAATNRELEAEVESGRVRRDLYFRLNVLAIRLPPLRERREDVPLLIDHLVASLAARHRGAAPEIDPDARRVLEAYDWPGNVRELVNALERALVLAREGVIRTVDLPDRLLAPTASLGPNRGDASATGQVARSPSSEPSSAALESLEELEHRHIQQVLAESATLEEAAARLGINVTTLWRKRRRYGID